MKTTRFYSYLNTANILLQRYDGKEPLSSFLKKFYSQHKKYGSADRKQITHLCYCFFRLGKTLQEISVKERIIAGVFLSANGPSDFLDVMNSEWNEKAGYAIDKKIFLLGGGFSFDKLFPWKDALSEGIDFEEFCSSFFLQPDLFLRIRPGYENTVYKKLEQHPLPYLIVGSNMLSFPNTTQVDRIIETDKEAVVQDMSSQLAGELLRSVVIDNANQNITVWDCCAASGGKSIMASDFFSRIDLTVSDVRASMLHNLKSRFKKAGITRYKSFVADLLKPLAKSVKSNYDLVIADVPCSGSGTWSRTPEQLYFFREYKIDEYALLQRKILQNIVESVSPGGYLLYITCSVFRKENEEAVLFLQNNYRFSVIEMRLLKGYDKKADTLFAALLQKPL